MAIERTTNTIGFSILESGTLGWGLFTNNNWDLTDEGFSLDRARITALESTSAVLPLAIVNRIAHNLIRNNIFARATTSDPAIATSWTSVFANGATGNTSRDSSTYLVGGFSQRISIVSVDVGSQTHPFPGLNVLDPDTNTAIASNDSRQLINGFGYVEQAVSLSPKTRYTVSAYGKSEIPNPTLGINVHWKVGVVFKDTSGSIIRSYFTVPQVNYTSNIETSSFERVELSFTTPDLPVVLAEIWLVSEGVTPGSIGSSYFDGVQLEQSTRATFLETFSMKDGGLIVDGDLTVGGRLLLQQDQLVLATNKVIFTGNVQLGDDITEDILDVYTKISTFYGPVSIKGDTQIGDNADTDTLDITVSKTTFYNDADPISPQGGNVCIQGNLEVLGSTVLGDNPAEDTVEINASLFTTIGDASVGGDLDVAGELTVGRAVEIGTNNASDSFTVNMEGQGTDIYGDLRAHNDLTVSGDVTLGTSIADTLQVNAGATILEGDLTVQKGLTVGATTPAPLIISSTTVSISNADTFDVTSLDDTTWNTPFFDLSGSLEVGTGSLAQTFYALVGNIVLGDPSLSASATTTINAVTTSATGDLSIDGDINIGGNTGAADVVSTTGSFVFGSNLLSAARSALSFSAIVITNKDSDPAIGGTFEIGDPDALIDDGYGRVKFHTTTYFNSGTTYFGSASTNDEVVGDVVIGGDLTVGGKTYLGNSTASDQVQITSYGVNVEVGSGRLNIGNGGIGFADNPYDLLATDHGGVSIDSNGNLFMDGKLTVKGPIDPISLELTPLASVLQQNVITVDLSGTETFTLHKEGRANLAEQLTIADGYAVSFNETAASFGHSSSPLTSFSVESNSASFSADVDVGDTLTVQELVVSNDAEVSGSMDVGTDLFVAGDLTALGTQFTLGNLTATTRLDVLAHETTFGNTSSYVGNVTVSNDLVVQRSATFGTDRDVDNFTSLAQTYTINIGSQRVDLGGGAFIETAGLRIGGGDTGPGYQNNVFNESELDHGGVTIDAYGNIFTDGSIFANGQFGINSLSLTSPDGTNLCETVLNVLNQTTEIGAETFTLDNLGHIEMHSHLTLVDKYFYCSPDSTIDGYGIAGTFTSAPSTDGYVMIEVVNEDLGRVFEVDNFGNVVVSGQIITEYVGASSVGAYSVTVGDGIESHGDFNLDGNHNASLNPIGAAVAYLSTLSSPGTIFIKKGTYPLTSSVTLPDSISLQGEGEGTILDGGSSTSTGVICGSGNNVRDLLIRDFTTSGISIGATEERVSVMNVKFELCSIGVDLDGTNSQVKGCHISSHTTGIAIDGVGHIVTENVILGESAADTGIDLIGDECILTSNYVVDHTVDGINVTGSDNIVTSNVTLRNP